jgi:hypothetical protein
VLVASGYCNGGSAAGKCRWPQATRPRQRGRTMGIARAALGARQFHFSDLGSVIDWIGAELDVLIYVRGEGLDGGDRTRATRLESAGLRC